MLYNTYHRELATGLERQSSHALRAAGELTEFDASLLEGFGEVFQLLEVGGVVGGGLERARFVRVRVQWRVRVRVQRGARAPRAWRQRREERAGAGGRAPRRR